MLASLEPASGPVSFRELVHHPALSAPELAEGTMSMTPDGTLVRVQTHPSPQRSEVGTRFVRITREGGEPDHYPIPARMRSLLAVLRGVLGGDLATLYPDAPQHLSTGPDGWCLDLAPLAPDDELTGTLCGCGPRPARLELIERAGVRRVLEFTPAS